MWQQIVVFLFLDLTPKEPSQVQSILLPLIFSQLHYKIQVAVTSFILSLALWKMWQQTQLFLFNWFVTQGAKASIKFVVVTVTCIFSITLENTSVCNKLCTCSGSLGEVIPVSVVPVYGLDTQGAKASLKLVVAIEFFNHQEKIQVAAISLVLTLAPWVSNKQAETTLFVASLPKGPRQV